MRHSFDRNTESCTRAPAWWRHFRCVGVAVSLVAAAQLVVLPRVAADAVIAQSDVGGSSVVGAGADQLGTNWYPNAGILPTQVNTRDFGELFDVALPSVDDVTAGQIYAQPIAADGLLLVVTENDNAYGVNPTSGAVVWSRNFGPAWRASTINCGDLAPTVGITGTPVVDSATGVAYFVTDTTPSTGGALWQMQAVDLQTGQEVADFPVTIQGPATNAPGKSFDAVQQMQRPGLALVKGVVYAAFGSHCDLPTWYGWIAGVTLKGVLNDMWVDETGSGEGAGIWGPGGIVVDSAGNLYVATGNGNVPAVGPGLGVPQPAGLGECVIKLSTSGAHLKLADYFCPSDANDLNTFDGDLGSGSPTGLPASFGTSKEPDLLVEAGKSGEVYLLDRDNLGGFDQGPDGGDKVVSETGPLGGVWSHPAVWPGDGGYVYITSASSPAGAEGGGGGAEMDIYQRVVSNGQVSLNWVGDVPNMPFGSSPPIVTSDRTVAGSGVVWNIARTGLTNAANLVAYGAVPVAGTTADPAGDLPVLWKVSVKLDQVQPASRIRRAYLCGQLRRPGTGVRSSRWHPAACRCRRRGPGHDPRLDLRDEGHLHGFGRRDRHRRIDQHLNPGSLRLVHYAAPGRTCATQIRGPTAGARDLRPTTRWRPAGHVDFDHQPRDCFGHSQRPRDTRGGPNRRDAAIAELWDPAHRRRCRRRHRLVPKRILNVGHGRLCRHRVRVTGAFFLRRTSRTTPCDPASGYLQRALGFHPTEDLRRLRPDF